MSAVLANISDAISDRNIARFYFIATYRVARQMNDIPVDIKTLVLQIGHSNSPHLESILDVMSFSCESVNFIIKNFKDIQI